MKRLTFILILLAIASAAIEWEAGTD